MLACSSSIHQRRSQQNAADNHHETHASDSRSSLLNSAAELDDVRVRVSSEQKKPSLFRALVRVVGPKLLQAHLCKLVADVLTFCGPLLQRFDWLCLYTVDVLLHYLRQGRYVIPGVSCPLAC